MLLLLFLAAVGQFRRSKTLRFAVTFQTVQKTVSNGALQPQFPIPQNLTFLCLCSPHNRNFFSIFHFSAVFGPNDLGRPPQTLTFQYRTPRSRPVIPSPRSFSAENIFLTQLSGIFPPTLVVIFKAHLQ